MKNEVNINFNIRKMNNLLSKENKALKLRIQELENKLENINFHDEYVDSLKKKIKKTINNNNSLNYIILNDVKDIYTLNNKIEKLKKIFNKTKIQKFNFDNFILNNKKEELQLKIMELKNKKNNLEILYNSGIQKKKNNEEIITKLNKIIENIDNKNNYINDDKEANKMIDKLLNEKQQLIEENINTINLIGNKPGDYFVNNDDNKEEEQIIILKNKNNNLNNKLNKYNNIITKINTFLNNNYNRKVEIEINIDKKIANAINKNANINNEIENVIKKYKNEIEKRDKIIDELKNKYRKINKADITPSENFML